MINVKIKVKSKFDCFSYNKTFKEEKDFPTFVNGIKMILDESKFVSFGDHENARTIKCDDVVRIFYEVC